jgi:hypothetical protein
MYHFGRTVILAWLIKQETNTVLGFKTITKDNFVKNIKNYVPYVLKSLPVLLKQW